MKEQEEIKYDFEYLQEANDERSIESEISLLYQHMIKYKFVPGDQGVYWVTTINTSLTEIYDIKRRKKGIWTRLIRDPYKWEKLYLDGLKYAIKENKSSAYKFPTDLYSAGPEFAMENVIDRSKVKKFLLKYLNKTREGVEEQIYEKFGND